ncbi:MAG TPA: protein kinase [Kofleriaceae bacterium]|nr:protein kinase [Kofleriaceae bacterium]
MATPGAQRAIAGVTLVERLSVGLYGELWRAHDGKRDLRALVIDPKLAAEPAFVQALMDDSRARITGLHSRALVGTASIARDATRFVVVTEPVLGGAALADLLGEARSRGGKLSGPIAAAVIRAVVDGLATAHAMDVVHGAVHPRSILIDADGAVRLADVAVGRALSRAAAHGADGLLRGLAGYLAPELALGEEPGPAADVYAAGATLFAMLTGEAPPGTSNLSPAMERLVQRALDTDLHRRFANAMELQENLAEALDDDRWQVAPQLELARWVAGSRAATAANLDEATEDLLASLAAAEPTRREPTDVGTEAGATSMTRPSGEHARAPSGALDSVLADLDESHETTDGGDGGDTGDVPYTQVDPTRSAIDPVSQLIGSPAIIEPTRRGSSGRERDPSGVDRSDTTPLPPPAPDAPGTITRSGQVAETGRHKLVEKAAMAALSDLDEAQPVEPPKVQRRAVVPRAPSEAPPQALKSSTSWIWIVVVLALGGVLVWVIKRSGDVNAANKQAHDDEAAKQQEAAAAKTKQLQDELPDPGGIRVRSTPDGAAVWLMLGRTPFDSMGLPANMVHELRVESDGFQAKDVDVGGRDWSDAGGANVAHVSVTLDAGEGKPLLAIPPKPDDALQQGLKTGRGVIHVESSPPGAAVWLLVGVTPNMDLEGIEAGRDYELRVSKDGFLPGYVHLSAEDWRDGGDPRLPLSAAPKKAVMERSVTLTPAPKGAKR